MGFGLAAAVSTLALTAEAPAPLPRPGPSVSGLVRDPVGRALEGVKVLVSSDRFVSTLVSVTTGQGGSFELTGLPPGRYQVAASKPGYQVGIVDLDTLLRRSVDLILRPLPVAAVADPEPPETGPLGWVLRVPTVDVLRDLEGPPGTSGAIVTAAAGDDPNDVAASAMPRVRGELVHTELAGGLFGSEEKVVDADGRSSQVRVRGEVNEQLCWHVLGDLRDLSRVRDMESDAVASGSEFNSRAVSMGVDYRPTAEDDLSVSLLFGRSRFRGEDEIDGPSLPLTEQEQEAWGYDARWSRLIDPLSQLDLRLSFLQGRIDLPGPPGDPLSAGADPAGVPLDHSRWDAGGSYRLALDDQHRVLVGLRTRVYRGEAAAHSDFVLAVPGLPIPASAELQEGWDLDLYGQDQWALDGPFEIVSSLAYSRTDDVRGEEFVIPRVVFKHSLEDGTVWNAGVLLAWNPSRVGGPATVPDSEAARVGYQLGLSRPLPQGFHLAVSAASHPARGLHSLLEEDEAFLAAPAVAADGLFLAHRRVETRELDLQLEKRFRNAVGRLGSTFGEAEGRLATGWEEFTPVVRLSEGSMRYVITRLQTVLDRSDTEFQVGFRKISEQSDPAGADLIAFRSYSVVDFSVAQRLAFLENLSRSQWRVVVAYQDVTAESAADSTADLLPDPTSTYSRLSGGIEIRF